MKGVWGWLFQRITGALLVAGLIVHFIIMHFSGHEQISHEFVMMRISSPYWKAFDLAFLVSVIYHGFNGMWGIAVEYVRPAKFLKAAQVLLLFFAFLLLAVGVYIITL